jgi:predicted DNA-binding WGR domain protein
MANVSERDSSSLHIILERVDPARNIARYYVLSIEPTLFAKHTLIRRWGRIGCLGRKLLQFFGGEDASQAQATLETWLARKTQARLCAKERTGSPGPNSFTSAPPAKFFGPTTWVCQRARIQKNRGAPAREGAVRNQLITGLRRTE